MSSHVPPCIHVDYVPCFSIDNIPQGSIGFPRRFTDYPNTSIRKRCRGVMQRLTSLPFLRLLIAIFLLAIPALLSTPALAQTSGTGSINGTVTDPSGSVVPNAAIKATNNATGVQTTTTSTSSGYFVLSL